MSERRYSSKGVYRFFVFSDGKSEISIENITKKIAFCRELWYNESSNMIYRSECYGDTEFEASEANDLAD